MIAIEGRLKSVKTFADEGDFTELERQVPAVFAEARKRLLQSRKRLRKILEQQNGLLDLEW